LYIDDKFYLGHDEPIYEIPLHLGEPIFLQRDKLFCHAKNIEALNEMLKHRAINCFWHQNDDYTLTKMNFIWTYPNKPIIENCIAVLPELHPDWDISKAIGICSDFIVNYKK
jgi:hypothetical protein